MSKRKSESGKTPSGKAVRNFLSKAGAGVSVVLPLGTNQDLIPEEDFFTGADEVAELVDVVAKEVVSDENGLILVVG